MCTWAYTDKIAEIHTKHCVLLKEIEWSQWHHLISLVGVFEKSTFLPCLLNAHHGVFMAESTNKPKALNAVKMLSLNEFGFGHLKRLLSFEMTYYSWCVLVSSYSDRLELNGSWLDFFEQMQPKLVKYWCFLWPSHFFGLVECWQHSCEFLSICLSLIACESAEGITNKSVIC